MIWRLLKPVLVSMCLLWAMTVNVSAQGLEKAWQQHIGGALNLAPVVGHGLVYVVPQGGHLQVFDLQTGEQAWQFNPQQNIWDRGLSLHDDLLLVCIAGGNLVALDAINGQQRWQTNLDNINCQRPAHLNNGQLYVSTTYVGPGLPNSPLTGATLFAINPDTGAINWRFKNPSFLMQTATTYADKVYLGSSYIDPNFASEEGGAAYYQALEAATGELLWTHESIYGLPKTLYATDQRLTYVAYEDFVVSLDRQTGEQLWQRDTENWVPALVGDGNTVYFGSANTFVHAWDVNKEQVIWRYNVPGQSFEYLLVKPVLEDGKLLFMTQQGNVFAISANKGEYLWSAPTKVISRIDPAFADGFLLIGDIEGELHAYRLP